MCLSRAAEDITAEARADVGTRGPVCQHPAANCSAPRHDSLFQGFTIPGFHYSRDSLCRCSSLACSCLLCSCCYATEPIHMMVFPSSSQRAAVSLLDCHSCSKQPLCTLSEPLHLLMLCSCKLYVRPLVAWRSCTSPCCLAATPLPSQPC